jgi:hypothetical protein
MDLATFLDLVKEKLGVKSDYALSGRLNIPTPRISNYRKGLQWPDIYATTQFARALGVSPMVLVAAFEAAAAKNTERRHYWEEILEEETKTARQNGEPLEFLVAWGGIEPPTRGFSIRCSTN